MHSALAVVLYAKMYEWVGLYVNMYRRANFMLTCTSNELKDKHGSNSLNQIEGRNVGRDIK